MPTLLASAALTLVFCAPGYPGGTGDAQPYLDQFAQSVAAAAGWPKGNGKVPALINSDQTELVALMPRLSPNGQLALASLAERWGLGDRFAVGMATLRKALADQPIGTSKKELQKIEGAALASLKAIVAARKEAARLASEQKRQREGAEWKVDLQLDHVASYLEREYEFEGGIAELRREAERLRPLIREALIRKILEKPDMSGTQIRAGIESYIDNQL